MDVSENANRSTSLIEKAFEQATKSSGFKHLCSLPHVRHLIKSWYSKRRYYNAITLHYATPQFTPLGSPEAA